MLRMTIAVFGAGGVGGYFGAVLARAGYPVGFIARGPHLEAIRKDGLHIRSPKGDFNITPAQVTDNPADVGPVESVLLAVKAWQVPEAARAIRPLLAPTTKVLPLQNGVETADRVQQVLGPQHTPVGLCRIISSVTAPGHICHAGVEPTIALGEPDGSVLSAKGQALADALRAAGVVVETPADIQAALWEKLVFIAALSGGGAGNHRRNPRVCPDAPTATAIDRRNCDGGTCAGHPAKGRCRHPDTCVRGELAS